MKMIKANIHQLRNILQWTKQRFQSKN